MGRSLLQTASVTVFDTSDRRLIDAKAAGDFLVYSGRKSNFLYLLLAEFCVPVACPVSVSAFCNAIQNIFCARPEKQMIRVHAWRIIAAVANHLIVSKRPPKMQFKGDAVRSYGGSIGPKKSIAITSTPTTPFPASAFLLLNESGKSVREGRSVQVMLIQFSASAKLIIVALAEAASNCWLIAKLAFVFHGQIVAHRCPTVNASMMGACYT